MHQTFHTIIQTSLFLTYSFFSSTDSRFDKSNLFVCFESRGLACSIIALITGVLHAFMLAENIKQQLHQGCIYKILNSYFWPPPLHDSYFSKINLIIMRGCAPQRYKFPAFFVAVLLILSQLGKKYAYFLPIGGGGG